MAVNQAGRQSGALGIDDPVGLIDVTVLQATDLGDAAIDADHGVGVEDWIGQVSRQHQSDIADDEFAAGVRLRNPCHL